MGLTGSSHKGEDQQWIHGGRPEIGWMVDGGWWRAFIHTPGRAEVDVGVEGHRFSHTSTPAAFPFPGPCITSAMFGNSVGL